MDMSNLTTTHHFDVIIVGSGGAGLSLALSLPDHFNIAVFLDTVVKIEAESEEEAYDAIENGYFDIFTAAENALGYYADEFELDHVEDKVDNKSKEIADETVH